MFYLLILANLLIIGSYAISYNRLPPQLPLFYSKPWGEDQLGENWMIFLILVLMNLFFVINRYVVNKFFPGNKFVNQVVFYANIFIILGFTLIFLKIIFSIA